MSSHAYLACLNGDVMLHLGMTVQDAPGGRILYFDPDPDEPLPSQDRRKSAAVWRILADHATHRCTVFYDWAPGFDALHIADNPPVKVGGDADTDVSYDDFLAGWPEGRLDDAAAAGSLGPAYLGCAECGERLSLGAAIGDFAGRVLFFHAGPGDVPNSQNPLLNRALWRLLAEHPMHELSVEVSTGAGRVGCRTIGGTEQGDPERSDEVSLADFVAGWPG